MGASYHKLNCFEPQTTVGVLTVPFSSQDIRRLESSKGYGKSLVTGYDKVHLPRTSITLIGL